MGTPETTTDVFSAPPPAYSLAELAEVAERLYGLRADVHVLDSERDQNSLLTTADARYVLKIANAAELRENLELQAAALVHLGNVAPTLRVPRLVSTADGHAIATVGPNLVRCVTYLDGAPYARLPHTPDLHRCLGAMLGKLSAALASFGHPAAHQPDFLWSLDNAQGVRPWVVAIADDDNRRLVEAAFERHRMRVLPSLSTLRAGIVHQDANDYNLIVDTDGHGAQQIGLIDFGDMTFGRVVNELAVGLAYALLDTPDIIATARTIIGAYVAEFELRDEELRVLFDLVVARLAMSIAISSHRGAANPDNDYLTVSQAPALRLLRRLMAMRAEFLHFAAREAAGLSPVPQHDAIVAWLQSADCRPAPALPIEMVRAARILVRLGTGAPGLDLIGEPDAHWQWMQGEMRAVGATFAVGAYGEARDCYGGDGFQTDAPEMRSVHLGIDLFVDANTPVQAMLDGVVVTVVDNAARLDYGPTVVLRHQAGVDGPEFFCLYGHLSRASLTTVQPGQVVTAGQTIGYVGDHTVNGGWAPHTHIELITDRMGDESGNFEGAAEPSRWALWSAIVPDANLLLRLAPESFTVPDDADDVQTLLHRRHEALPPSLSISYRKRLHIVRGTGTYLFDRHGQGFLDCVNNVCHVGHANPRVVEAMARQAGVLNTNTRYLHRTILDYAERLGALFPDPLHVVYLVNSGSEATELALRLARTVTGRHDVITLDWGYHGNTAAAIEVSPYKFNRKGGAGRQPHIHVAELPDPYRGTQPVQHYIDSVTVQAEAARARNGAGPAAFIAESISGCGGQVVLADGYLAGAHAAARAAGALCIADEVQVGFGRVGDALWAYEAQGVTPDIVTLGKPIGNGHPLGAVVTTQEIAAAFANGMEYFNTFGGNPVSCAVGIAVLDEIEQRGLQHNAADAGDYLLDQLRELQQRHDCIGDVRGRGLYIGVDLVLDRVTKAEATTLAADVVNHMRERGVLVSTDGPADNVLKIKPPIVFDRGDADVLCAALDDALNAVAPR